MVKYQKENRTFQAWKIENELMMDNGKGLQVSTGLESSNR